VGSLAAEPPPPASVALTVDTSGSVGRSELDRARDLALAVLAGLPTGSEVAVIAFDDQSRVVVPSTSHPEEVREQLASLKVGGRFTALHDALYDASRYVRDAPGARKAIVLITDGVDENSALNLEDGLRVATDAQIPVFAIGVGAHPQERVLRRIAKLTGGEYFTVDQARGADLAALIAALPAGGGQGVSATAAGGTGTVASGSAAAGATRRTPPATVPPRLVTPGAGGKRAVWIALALTAAAAIALVVAAWRQKRGVPACPECARPLPPDATICPSCAAAPTRIPPRMKPPRREPPELSATVLARMNTTEEYLERNGHAAGAPGARDHARARARAKCSSSAPSPPRPSDAHARTTSRWRTSRSPASTAACAPKTASSCSTTSRARTARSSTKGRSSATCSRKGT